MNDPQEALETNAFGIGLLGRPDEPLQLSPEEDALFRSRDWSSEINDARRSVKVGAFSMDVIPDLADVDPEQAEYSVPRRLAASRGYAHPRMWAQYGDAGRGVCLVLDHDRLEQAVKDSVADRCGWGYGAVSYRPIEHEYSLGFLEIRDLLQTGVDSSILKNFEQSLLTKHADWEHEAEFRFFVMDGGSEPWDVPITRGVVVGLVLGANFDSRYFRNVRAFSDAFGIRHRVRKLCWAEGRARLLPLPL